MHAKVRHVVTKQPSSIIAKIDYSLSNLQNYCICKYCLPVWDNNKAAKFTHTMLKILQNIVFLDENSSCIPSGTVP